MNWGVNSRYLWSESSGSSKVKTKDLEALLLLKVSQRQGLFRVSYFYIWSLALIIPGLSWPSLESNSAFEGLIRTFKKGDA